VSSVELVDLCVERIATHNRRFNAIVTLDAERARAEAADADARLGAWLCFEDEAGQSLRRPGVAPGAGAAGPRSCGCRPRAPVGSRSPG
jgi:Asp-tRNAAsn/Glu-tRNAGln amidotransferase A subunit and related amidases